VRGPTQCDVRAQAPPSASRPVAARNCPMVAMPASTLNGRCSALSGRAVKMLATASWPVAPKRVRRTKPTRTPPISTTVVSTGTRLVGTARRARWQYPLPNRANVEESLARTVRYSLPKRTDSTGKLSKHQVQARSNNVSSVAKSTPLDGIPTILFKYCGKS